MAAPMAAAARLLRLTSSSSVSTWFFRRLSSSVAVSSLSLISRRTIIGNTTKAADCRIQSVSFTSNSRFGCDNGSSNSEAAAVSFDSSAEPVDAVPGEGATHPWSEWEEFLEKLRGKGYFHGGSSEGEEGQEEGGTASSMDFNHVKVGCLSFARKRFDLLRYIDREDIQSIVECGCPTTKRKPTNSGKRLRAYLMLDEKDVCSACSLQNSCDRANLVLNEEEGGRTVDVLRIILSYATDPALFSRFDLSEMGKIEGAIRRILSQLINLIDTVEPPAAEAMTKHSTKKERTKRSSNLEYDRSQNVEMKRGDWICSKCNFLNFARNLRCLECKADGPKTVDPGDVEMKKGDWTCPQCRFMNFARNRTCKRCRGDRPPRELNPGEWECPSCNFLNFRRNRVCLKCKWEHPGENPSDSAEHLWRKPSSTRYTAVE